MVHRLARRDGPPGAEADASGAACRRPGARRDPVGPPSGRADGPPPGRPQPVRDAIWAYLTEPRRAKEIADRIGRTVPNATGHLRAMARRGLVVRLRYGVYARADPRRPAPAPAALARSRARDRILAVLDRVRGPDEVAAAAGCGAATLRGVLLSMRRAGVIARLGDGRFARVGGRVHAEDGARLRSVDEPSASDEVLAALEGDRTAPAIAARLGKTRRAVGRILRRLAAQGRAVRLGAGVYARADGEGTSGAGVSRCPPVRAGTPSPHDPTGTRRAAR